MSDNISADEVKRRLVIFLRIPAKVWTDVLKLLPRRILVQKISPVCKRFKEISDKNVKNIHVIMNAGIAFSRSPQFSRKLEKDDPEAKQQLEHLAANSCHLAGQFQLLLYGFLSFGEKSQAILRHCPDLFNGCKLSLHFNEKNKGSTMFLESLTQLEKAKPVQISVSQYQREDQVIGFWQHPTFQHCTRVRLFFGLRLSTATSATTFVNIFDWLHHQPIGMDCDGAADQQVRCMIVQLDDDHEQIDLLLYRCSENLQQGQAPTDRRPYVLSFQCCSSDWSGFDHFRRVENKSTGEVLILDRMMEMDGDDDDDGPIYRLRRCLAEEEANGPEFYAGVFNDREGGFDEQFIEIETPKVTIG